MLFRNKKLEMPRRETALPGRPQPILAASVRHHLLDRPLMGHYPDGAERAVFAMGCFWGAERKFWQAGGDGILVTAVGYAGGFTENATYEEVCSGRTGHTEVVLVVFDPARTSYEQLLRTFWESHDPTQGMRQGNDVGTQYRSAIYWTTERQRELALASKADYERRLAAAGFGPITTEIEAAPPFYFAEAYHQQYLAKVPNGYCGLGGTGVACALPTGVGAG